MKAIVVEHPTILSLLESHLSRGDGRNPTAVVICCMTRDDFLEDLVAAHSDMSDPPKTAAVERLLKPTINAILASRAIRLVFTPTIQHVRAYLAVLNIPPHACVSLLHPISLHYGSSEFSAQGFMQTFALAIEAAARNDAELIELCELSDAGDDDPTPWDIEVPLLSDSAELDDEDDGLGDRNVSVRRVAERWFEVPERKRDGREESPELHDRDVIEEGMDLDEDGMMLV